MENEDSILRFSSCRGVSFEINSNRREDPFSVSSNKEEEATNKWEGLLPLSLRRSSSQVSPHSQAIQRSSSRPSTHFCDVEDLDDIEAQLHGEEEEEHKLQEASIQKDEQKQRKNNPGRLSAILLDWGLFTVYKRLFIVCLAVNMVVITLAATENFPYGRRKPAVCCMVNILALTLCRSEAFLRFVFFLAVKALGRPRVPLLIKTATTALLQSLGGVHSGCGVAALAWLSYSLVLVIRDKDEQSLDFIIVVVAAILALLLVSAIAAFPLLRHVHHNVFEYAHRFAGWAALALLWVFNLITLSYDPVRKSFNLAASKLVQHPELWLTTAITLLILLPWLSVRRVPVEVTTASGHAAMIKFAGGVSPGLLGRISRSPLLEWHAFGIISDGKAGHMILAGAVGDFTRRLVADPPRHLWIRSVHFAGLPYLVNIYDRIVLVATGSGICVFLSFLLQPCRADVCLVWVAKGIEENYGKEIVDMVSGYPDRKVVIHDTAVAGRPNVAEMSVEAARRWAAEAVVVTSNPKGSRDVVRACKHVGIPAFGPTWDS